MPRSLSSRGDRLRALVPAGIAVHAATLLLWSATAGAPQGSNVLATPTDEAIRDNG